MQVKRYASTLLRKFGFQLVRTEAAPSSAGDGQARLNRFVEKLAQAPLDDDVHLAYAIEAARCNRPYLAYAELKSAEFLGADPDRLAVSRPEIMNSLPDVATMNHNQYFRFASLAAEIRNRSGDDMVSVLDVGGGQGELAAFIGEARYCLCEPGVNGISGNSLPFSEGAFDYVVACHVLEHVPVEAREGFLDQLLSKSRRGVILLNPFQVPATHVDERLALYYEITGAEWAREHVAFTLPRLESIEAYAKKNGVDLEVKPNGSLTTSAALVFMNYFAANSDSHSKLSAINKFFNTRFTPIMDSSDYPNAYMVYLARDNGGFTRGLRIPS